MHTQWVDAFRPQLSHYSETVYDNFLNRLAFARDLLAKTKD
jgi:hypothetical protein